MKVASPINQESRLLSALQQRLNDSNISSTALVFTFFCDVVTQHGGEVWLGNVIQALAPLNINERNVRTAVFRLVKDGWLVSRKQGRRSYYRLTDTGRHYYQRAARRIYLDEKPEWDGMWMLLFVSMVPEDKRESLHRGLSWLGYGRLATGVYALPGRDRTPLDELLSDLNIEDNIVHMQAQSDGTDSLKELVLSKWQLHDLQYRYEEYGRWLKQADQDLRIISTTDPQTLLLLRIVLIHEYRRILLTDPELPGAMLPADWPGAIAKSQTAELYHRIYTRGARWFQAQLPANDRKTSAYNCTTETRFTNTKVNK